jgi:DNA-binding XRE family transcriptional regulator
MNNVTMVRNISALRERMRVVLDTWDNVSINDNRDKFVEYIGLRLRLRRIYLGYTQTKIAKLLNCTFQQVQKYERGVNAISLEKLITFCEATDTSLDWFMRPINKLGKKLYINGRDNDTSNQKSRQA